MRLLLSAVVDTNWFIGAAEGREVLPPLPVHSVVTRLELLSAPNLDPKGIGFWERLLAESAEIDLARDVVNRAAELRRQFGRRLPDAAIAASAVLEGLPLLTRDRGMARYASVVALPALD